MLKQIFTGFADYGSVNESYLRQRQLRGNTGFWLLWSYGVGVVISGNFTGWNSGLIAGGFWGMTIATLLMAIMYICLTYSLSEMSAMLPHTGGLYSFTRTAFGPFWGYICGVAMIVENVLAPVVAVIAVTSYLKPLIPGVPAYLVWVVIYAIFTAINIWGMKQTFNVGYVITLIALIILTVFYVLILALGVFKMNLLFNVPANTGQLATWLPKGVSGIFAAIPYAIWFYLAIEQLPLAAEESRNASDEIPRSLIAAMFTLVVLSGFTLVLNSGVGNGAVAVGQSSAPLGYGLEAYFGKGPVTTFSTAVLMSCGLLASFHFTIYAYGRTFFSLARAGYIPRWLAVTGKSYTPYRSLLLGTVVGLICAVTIDVLGGEVKDVMLNMAVFGALIIYILVLLSYIKLKSTHPDLPRPYQSPLGIWGAAVGALLAIVALLACLSVPAYRPGAWGVAIFTVIAILYFLFYSKNHLVAQAPEEKAALIIMKQRV
ncbi:amino acid ABC transporter permease [Brasilonema octagenarum UFV-E1]|uniref:Amino acid ABC transporter permease n=1 Tax=Brasilonema sennae CENA114 TaxID=415709 RepID=A0A856MAX6_9CYAN|nr:amino acid permease [Brasilonema sennae]QDL07888.1 amino acid ABC transporter permease [Brasilonema sennae CENA114]QDL14248.1 amino acid ABC transporter permease [Brasilonema octagenarum UFV-E1]